MKHGKKQEESRKSAANTVRSILNSELQANLAKTKTFHDDLSKSPPEISFDKLETGAWTTISGGSLVISIDEAERDNLLKMYGLINKANEYHERILESSVGVASAMSGARKLKAQLTPELLKIWKEIEENIDSLNDSNK